MKPGSILFVGNHLKRAAGDRYINDELVQRLRDNGWTTHTTSNKKPRLLRLLDIIWTIMSKRKAYQAAEVDVFSGPAFFWAEVATNLLRILRKPTVLTLHGGNLPGFTAQHTQRVYRLLSLATEVVTPSPYLYNEFQDYCKNIQIIPNPIEIEQYPFRLREHPAPRLIWLRAFHEIYNPSLAPRVLALLRPKFKDLQLTMIGPDKGDGSLKKMLLTARELRVQDIIKVTGSIPREEVPHYLNQNDVFINTTNIDNTPVSVIEAMACGLCIVSTDVGGIPSLLQDGIDALLVPPGDPAAMSESIQTILSSSPLAADLSKKAHEHVKKHDWGCVYRDWEDLFYKIIKENEEFL